MKQKPKLSVVLTYVGLGLVTIGTAGTFEDWYSKMIAVGILILMWALFFAVEE